ncbi:hypothetical protein TNCT_678711 [Trichonephila clavata]|uniref:Uncharacterized protein n=1 Tax=Trichonephila clavata TaxID=2740835 RepID=A0A8X6GBD7_TRICU|nr:hypothetical protein TNCT_678711 [Trichonephila clavata]
MCNKDHALSLHGNSKEIRFECLGQESVMHQKIKDGFEPKEIGQSKVGQEEQWHFNERETKAARGGFYINADPADLKEESGLGKNMAILCNLVVAQASLKPYSALWWTSE